MTIVNNEQLEHLRTYEKRFWRNVDKDDEDECWDWNMSLDIGGYGIMTFRRPWEGGKTSSMKAHRYSWLIHNGLIPEGILVLHTCDIPACCNPNHLFLGTTQDNIDDKVRKGNARGNSIPRTPEQRKAIGDKARGRPRTEESKAKQKATIARLQKEGLY